MRDELLIPFGAILGLSFFAFLVKFVKGKEQESAPEPDAEDEEYDGDDQFIVRWDKDGNQAEWGRDVWP